MMGRIGIIIMAGGFKTGGCSWERDCCFDNDRPTFASECSASLGGWRACVWERKALPWIF